LRDFSLAETESKNTKQDYLNSFYFEKECAGNDCNENTILTSKEMIKDLVVSLLQRIVGGEGKRRKDVSTATVSNDGGDDNYSSYIR